MRLPDLDHSQLLRLFDQLPAMVWMVDRGQKCCYLNDFFLEFSGRELAEDLGRPWLEIVHPEDSNRARQFVTRRVEGGIGSQVDLRLRRRDGSWRWMHCRGHPIYLPNGDFAGTLGTGFDVTDSLKNAQEIARLVTHDKLTGLPKREVLERSIDRSLEAIQGTDAMIPVLVFSVDRLSVVNETLGHNVGDEMLIEIGSRLSNLRTGGEIAGHLAGRRFVLVGEPSDGTDMAYRAAARLIAMVRTPIRINGDTHEMGASVGIALYPGDAEDGASLVRAAEVALQVAKQSGGNNFAFFDPVRHGQNRERFDLAVELRRAITEGELVLHFQPKVAMPGYTLVGFEALVRWQHPKRGLLPPSMFIDLAEEMGLMKPLTQWVFESVGAQIRDWLAAGLSPVPVAVNVAPHQFLTTLMGEHMLAYQRFGLPQGLLELEITESTMIEDFDGVCAIVEALDEAGICVAMDDFGTGYSSLVNLNKLPISSLKIDRAFTKDVHWDRSSRAVASAIISMARELGLDVIAEGVETVEQLQVLRSLDCHVIQGYLTGKPMNAAEATELLRHPSPIPNPDVILVAKPVLRGTL
jgi:diguanylate cyclase (GGDEF)-like protein/PAS domain S-box-containing protein